MADDLQSVFDGFKSVRRHGKDAKAYLARRREFADALGTPGMWHYVDHFGLYAGTQTIATYLTVHELVRATVNVPGHIMEFGSHHGAKLLYMAKVLELYTAATVKKVYGFDSFEGLKTFHEADGHQGPSLSGAYKGNEDVLLRAIELFGFAEWVHIVKGDARATIPAFETAFPDAMVSLAYIDFDLYEPCKAALDFLATRLSSGGIVAFDEALTDFFPGEGVAMREYLQDQAGAKFEMRASPIALQPTVWLIKQ